MGEADNFYKKYLAFLWKLFYIIAAVFAAFTVIFTFHVNKLLKSFRTEKEYKKLFADVIKFREAEKQNMVLEIHDTVIQDMTFSKMLCMDLVNAPDSKLRKEKLEMLTGKIANALKQIRDISYDIRPPELEKDLKRIISIYVENWKIKTGKNALCKFTGLETLKITDTFKLNLYRIIQELLINIEKHSDADSVKIHIVVSYPSIILKIADNSSGFDFTKAADRSDGVSHAGLWGITERVKISHGDMKIRFLTGEGIVVTITFPIEGNIE